MKRTLAVLLTLALLLTLVPSAALAKEIPAELQAVKQRGDVNGDGTINAKDVTVLRRYLAGGYGIAVDERVGDANNDGTINAKDVTVLRRYLAGGYGITLAPIPEDKLSYADAVTGGQLYTDLGAPQFGEAAEGKFALQVFVDGVAQGDGMKEKIVSGNTDEIAPVGSSTEVEINRDTMCITISTSKYYAAQIDGVFPAEGGRQAYVTLKAFDSNAVPAGEVELADSTKVTQAFLTDAFAGTDADDFVVYTKEGDLVRTLAPAEAKIGKVSDGGVTASAVALDGTSYKFAASADALTANVGAPVGVCLDPNGNVLCSENISFETIGSCAIFLAAAKADREKGDPRTMPVTVPETIKLLVIGNSFGNDSSLVYLANELKSVGVQNVVVGTLYYSGCPYSRHLEFALKNSGKYDFYKNGSMVWEDTATLDYALAYEDWTHIMVLSGFACKPDDFVGAAPWQDLLLCYVRRMHPDAYLGYDMTWAFKSDFATNHSGAADGAAESFVNYHSGDQMTMYNHTVEAVHTHVIPDQRFKFIAPVGTAIQNARTSFLGDNLNRDGYHLNKGIGRYIATLTVCCTLTGVSPDEIAYRPNSGLKSNLPAGLPADNLNTLNALRMVACESVKNALEHPYEVTQSAYQTFLVPTPGENELPIA